MASRQYELVYIVSPDATEQQLADLQALIEATVSRFGGSLDNTENWGRRKMAYEIGPHKEGVYVLHQITGAGDLVKELDRRLRVADQVIRHLLVRTDEELRVAERDRLRRREAAARRRAARGLPPEPEVAEPRVEGEAQDQDQAGREA
ncbi:MAG: 30S ribosomal protein S6 [Acidobacteria bacterium]|nr:30S ribosomal protein S6 [Acidobacteriota bacterium]